MVNALSGLDKFTCREELQQRSFLLRWNKLQHPKTVERSQQESLQQDSLSGGVLLLEVRYLVDL